MFFVSSSISIDIDIDTWDCNQNHEILNISIVQFTGSLSVHRITEKCVK